MTEHKQDKEGESPSPDQPCGRYAPSPTGSIHLGNARTALVAWLSIRSRGGRFLWRVEDLDAPRTVKGMAEEQARDLKWLGLDWDLETEPQSQRDGHYRSALRQLVRAGRLFPCSRTRRELREIASAPHGRAAQGGTWSQTRGPLYTKDLRPDVLPNPTDPQWLEDLLEAEQPEASIRFLVSDQEIQFVDLFFGKQLERVSETVGDFVLRRRDGVWAYQLAVVVDDLDMGVSEVIRGADLLDSTARQIQLFEALIGETDSPPIPAFGHVPLLLNEAGKKLSKRDNAMNLETLRDQGITPEQVVGYLAQTLGLNSDGTALPAQALVPRYKSELLAGQTEPVTVPADLIERLRD